MTQAMLCVILSLLLPLSVAAQQPTFWGIKLHQPLTQLPACQKWAPGTDADSAPCFEGIGGTDQFQPDDPLRLRNVPAARQWVSAGIVDSRVEQLSKTYPIAEADTLAPALKEKFGAPSSVSQQITQNRFGMKTIQRVMVWKRRGFTVQFVSPQDLDTCSVMAWTPAQTAYERAEAKENSSSKASEF